LVEFQIELDSGDDRGFFAGVFCEDAPGPAKISAAKNAPPLGAESEEWNPLSVSSSAQA
jgi:hypothetical protein